MKKLTFSLFAPAVLLVVVAAFLAPTPALACTIVSAVASNGQVWNANNEDGAVGVGEFINVFPKTGRAKYGYYTLSHFSPKLGEGSNLQGGMNEAGLTFDFNAIKWVENFDPKTKQVFPPGDEAILPHILATMSSVQEVIRFFETYWFQQGFRGAQMHVADRQGRFAIISASGMQLMEKGQPLVSTNFDICGKEDGSSCWRYPKATAKLAAQQASLATMMAICKETAQGESTLYSNVQNLSTGDIWFFSQYDPQNTVNVNLKKLLAQGRKSYAFTDLRALMESRPARSWTEPKRIDLAEDQKAAYTGTFFNEFTGPITVSPDKEGLKITTIDGQSQVLQPQSWTAFFLPQADVRIEFTLDKDTNHLSMSMYENGFWAFSAVKAAAK
ncbi:hypothetical protein ACW9KT_19815 [Hymenobacter sp. HD11105]